MVSRSGPMNISYRRSESAPYCIMITQEGGRHQGESAREETQRAGAVLQYGTHRREEG